MDKFKLLSIILFGMFCSVEGNDFKISGRFEDGNLTFSWPKTRYDYTDFTITLGKNPESAWNRTYGQSLTIDNVLAYEIVRIKVRDDRYHIKDYFMTYTVNKFEAKVGDTRNISWTIDEFPASEMYKIFHFTRKDECLTIIDINSGEAVHTDKYVYQGWPINTTNIQFQVRNITVADAGHYVGGVTKSIHLTEGDAVLIVYGKPVKPVITGGDSIKVNTRASLKCESRSTSAPHYYKTPLTYIWYINDTRNLTVNTETYNFMVTKDLKFTRYSCQMKENLTSEKSKDVLLDPFYGPESVLITPRRIRSRLAIKDGETFGAYNCSSDCNPPCTLQWKYGKLPGAFVDATPTGKSSVALLELKADRTRMTLIQCVAINTVGRKEHNITLDILYISDPKFYLNGYRNSSSVFSISEKNRLVLSCNVEGNPTPNISVTRIPDLTMPGQSGNGWFNHTFQALHCSNTGTYNCKGNGSETKETNITINVTCTLRNDTSEHFKSIYGSMSGPNVTLKVRVPVISNPPPSAQEISWAGPGIFTKISQSLEQRENTAYKQWVLSTIPVKDKTYFGNYTMKYGGRNITTITINAEDKPEPPLNFSWYSYDAGYINLTWISKFNGGPEQLFILSQKEESDWTVIKNLTDPGEGNMGYYDLGPLTPGREYWYQLESCNRINCSLSPMKIKVKVKALPILSSSLFGDNTILILVGASAAGFLLVVILTVAVMMYRKTTKKSATKKRDREEGLSGSTVQDDSPADVVVYAAVDKSVLMKNRQQDDVVKSDVIKDTNDDNDAMYSEVIKHPKKQQTVEKKEKKKNEEKELKENNDEAGASTSNDNSRSTNQDGLVYIDVEFARKSPSSDTKGRPVVHGEEERTEYTFVDFSQKAPPVQERQENVT